MKQIKLLFSILLLSSQLHAQWVQCDTMTIKLITDSIKFKDNVFSSSDSVITLPFINNTSANFAYPQAKLINTTALPTGMTLHDANWQVFASAWNMGDTATASIGYDVAAPIPNNYTVTFKVYCKNFAPLAYDSCEFVNTVTVNLKPVGGTGVVNVDRGTTLSVYPNPGVDKIKLIAPTGLYILYAITGVAVGNVVVNDHSAPVDISYLPQGVYFIRGENGAIARFLKN